MTLTALYIGAVCSSLFRLSSYVFLRVIPIRWLKYVVPGLYLAYLTTIPLASRSPPPTREKEVRPSSDAVEDDEPPTRAKEPLNRNQDIFWELLFSLPTTRLTSVVTWSINTLLILLAADFVFTPVLDSATDVKVTLRNTYVRVQWRPLAAVADDRWRDGPILHLGPESDWTNTTKLTKLWPFHGIRMCVLYTLADIERRILPYPTSPIRFRTFPDSRLLTGFSLPRIKGFDLLADYLFPEPALVDTPEAVPDSVASDNSTESPNPLKINVDIHANLSVSAVQDVIPATEHAVPTEFMLFLGDFVYADVPAYHGDSTHAYRRLYRRNYNSPSFRKIYERLPIIHTYDDHEIINNYAGQSNDTPPFVNADDAFRIYNGGGNYDSHTPGEHYHDFRYGDVAFFVMDTRRHRSGPFDGEAATRTMLGDAQLSALYEWLGKVNQTATFKFIVTSVPFTSLWTHDAQTDSQLLSALHTVPNVFLLSGDRHEFAAIEFNPVNEGAHVVREFSTSPLSMFYVPLVRTLRVASEAVVRRTRLRIVDEENPPEEVVEEVPAERVFKYLPIGNYKWSTFEIDTRNPEHPKLNLEVVIDGKVAYSLPISGTPVKLRSSTALGSMVSDSFKEILDRVGLSPNRWF
ncbi:PhoD-like phosphatase-domain-containing protein [Lactarius deliciosus]|nr:PhoD-like phosphatase-domain-containing protein [Lactarius deliciosus]